MLPRRSSSSTSIPLEPWAGKAILLVDLDAFFASVEQADHPEWKGKPVIVGGDPDKRGVVSTASYEARKFGVRSAMPSSQAARLCPEAIWTRGRYSRYREVSNAIMAICSDETPFMQQVSIDEAFLDVTPTRVNLEHPVLVAQRIQSRVADLGVSCSIGVGSTKTVAKVASDIDKPRGLTVVYPGRERGFLSPLPIRCMSGVGAVAERKLHEHGIRTLGQMAEADEGLLRDIYGKNAGMMRMRAMGGDADPVESDDEVKSISHETSFAVDLTEREDIEAEIAIMAAKVGRRLRKKMLVGHTVGLKVRMGDRTVHSAQKKFEKPTDDELAFTPYLYRLLDEVWRPGFSVRLVGVSVTGLCDQAEAESCEGDQLSLFDEGLFAVQTEDPQPIVVDDTRRRGLLSATDAVRDKFGEASLVYGREIRHHANTTGSSSKNPEDYK